MWLCSVGRHNLLSHLSFPFDNFVWSSLYVGKVFVRPALCSTAFFCLGTQQVGATPMPVFVCSPHCVPFDTGRVTGGLLAGGFGLYHSLLPHGVCISMGMCVWLYLYDIVLNVLTLCVRLNAPDLFWAASKSTSNRTSM